MRSLLHFAVSIIVVLSLYTPANGRDRTEHPALIPLPRLIEWSEASFDLDQPLRIVVSERTGPEIRRECMALLGVLGELGVSEAAMVVGDPAAPGVGGIGVTIGPVAGMSGSDEAYALEVGGDSVVLTGASAAGVFRGVQTIRQLAEAGSIAGCHVVDAPAYRIRGMMFDVGRNFISMPTLKTYIDVMAAYKCNTLHFHMTEHIAWRFEVRSHPELTAAEHMIRNRGQYYTQDELRELVRYCRERHIEVIPEIDMPGHSDAFTRAIGHEMQTPEGMDVLRDVLEELCDTFDGSLIHLGSDEVRIENPDFIPEMAKVVRARGREVVLWRPGGPLDGDAVYQLWHSGAFEPGETVIDSRDLYMNHLDWFSGVPHAFARRVCDSSTGDETRLGVISCLWPDRRVADEHDQFRMSPVLPLLLTTAERGWRGGGYEDHYRVLPPIDAPMSISFRSFEERLVRHRDRLAPELPFVYVKQSDLAWSIYGPYDNEGDLARAFVPEQADAATDRSKPITARGGTIYLGGWRPQDGLFGPMQNATAYAEMYIHADRAMDCHMLIGFRSWSRSHRDGTPKSGAWDHRRSWIRLNGEPIEPPQWAKPGRTGNAEDPLIDEGYAYRPPTPIQLRRGWNRVLVKAPIGRDRTKWMFTVVPVSYDGAVCRELDGVRYSATGPRHDREEADQ
jgi:hexosaminidase